MATVALGAVGTLKRFGNVVAVKDVSIDVLAGEVHALIGENGAGKSTLVKILSGVHLPDEGHVVIGGEAMELGSPTPASRPG